MLQTTTELTPDQGMLCILNSEGDTKIIWNRNNPEEAENARRTFDHFRSKRFAAYSVKGKEGEKGEVVREFDPNAERIIFAPPMVGG